MLLPESNEASKLYVPTHRRQC